MVGLFLDKLETRSARSLHSHGAGSGGSTSFHNEVPASAFETSGPMGMVFMTAAEIDRARHMEALLRLTALKLSIAMYHPHERSKKLKLRARLAPHRDELRALFIYRQEAAAVATATTNTSENDNNTSRSGGSGTAPWTASSPRGSPSDETCPPLPLPSHQHRTLSGDAHAHRRRSPSPHPLFGASEPASTDTQASRQTARHQLHIPLERARSYSPTRSSSSALLSPPPLTFPAPPSPPPPMDGKSPSRLRSKSPVAWIKSKLPRNLLDRISPVEERENWFDDLEDDFDGTLQGIMEDEAWLPVTPEGEYPPTQAANAIGHAAGDEGVMRVEEDDVQDTSRGQQQLQLEQLSEREKRQNEMATKAAAQAEEHDLGHDLKWRLEALIGKGVIGLVYRAVLLPPSPSPPVTVAVKHLHLPSANHHLNHRNFEKLIATLSLITHPNIISYFGSHVVGESAFLFMELCNQGTLTDWMRRNGPIRDLGLLAVWIAHVANGLWFIHRNGVVHRDVKPSNIMIRDNVLKLADFSSAKLHGLCCQKVHDTQMAGSPSYMAPEVITGGQSKSSVVGAQDMWSFGCVIYEMVTGRQPFEEVDNVWSLYFLLGQYSSLHASLAASASSTSSSTSTSPTTTLTSTSRVTKFFHKVRRSTSSKRAKATDAVPDDPVASGRASTSSSSGGAAPLTPPATPGPAASSCASLADSLKSDNPLDFAPDPTQPLPAPAAPAFPILANHHPLLSRLCAHVPDVNPELLDLVAQCLTWDPEARISAQRVLQHPFVKKWARRAVV